MKTWNDIKKGDYIYYYDHCKYHKQLVHEVKEETQTESFTDWFGNKHETTQTRFIIRAGRSCFILSNYWKSQSWCWANGMKRFTCEEAYKIHENKMNEKLIRRYKKAKLKYDMYVNILKNHGIEIV